MTNSSNKMKCAFIHFSPYFDLITFLIYHTVQVSYTGIQVSYTRTLQVLYAGTVSLYTSTWQV